MNWLAHLLLSEPDAAFRIGNLLPDVLSINELDACDAEFRAGILRHQEIDALTDSSPVVKASIRRIAPPFRRFGGIIVDILFDHFITTNWSRYSTSSLPVFIAEVHASFAKFESRLPTLAYQRLEAMRRGNWLNSYGDLDGLRTALDRTGSRLRKPVRLGEAVALITPHLRDFRDDFETFFPQLQATFSPMLMNPKDR